MKDITRVSDVNYLGDVLSVNDCGWVISKRNFAGDN